MIVHASPQGLRIYDAPSTYRTLAQATDDELGRLGRAYDRMGPNPQRELIAAEAERRKAG